MPLVGAQELMPKTYDLAPETGDLRPNQ